jgi:hypothetical protein
LTLIGPYSDAIVLSIARIAPFTAANPAVPGITFLSEPAITNTILPFVDNTDKACLSEK